MVYDKSPLKTSLTTALLISALLTAFLAPRWDFLDKIDGQMFHFGTWLLHAPKVSKDIYTVHIPDELIQKPEGVKQLRLSLTKLEKNKPSSVALLLSQLPRQDFKFKGKWLPTEGELTKLARQLSSSNIVVGIPVIKQSLPSLVKSDNESYLDYLNNLLFSKINHVDNESFQDSHKYKIAPFLSQPASSHKMPLAWMTADNEITLDLALELYKKSQGVSKHRWIKSEGMKVGRKVISADHAGNVMGFHSTSGQHGIKQINLDELSSLSNNKIKNNVFILGDNKTALLATANHFSNLNSKLTYHTSTWANWFKKIAFVFVFVYLLLFISRLRVQTGYLLSLLLLFGALVFQYGLLLIQSVWLPLVSLYAFLILGHFGMLMKKSVDTKINSLRLHTHEALLHLAQYQFEQGDQNKSLTNLLKCSPTADVLELMYKIGLNFERRRQYENALQLYSDIEVRNSGYKDIKKRLKSLQSIPGNKPATQSPLQADQTLLMPDLGLQLPVFGRYEIERELGRGAMGVVYLGKDPKINRQVAIKTLDYSQFSESEIKTFKSRFFREAEAAGRLNHNCIVTVYDVGEESDFAFIAMDFIEGKSLEEFCKIKTLLPVREVYEIAATVAETLDYAHSKKIIHRDIKPSNIMYEPKTHKLKVTDFGIARITDNQHTRTGSFLGSPSYMSPEQMIGSNVGHQADIYALGVSFYQLLTGSLPFKADNIAGLAHDIANKKPIPIKEIRPDLPASATRIINKALQKKPGDRYNSGKEMADAIRRGMPEGN